VTAFHVRKLPHYDPIDHPIFLTWRLSGTLPPGRFFHSRIPSGQVFLAMDRLLDNARTGPLHWIAILAAAIGAVFAWWSAPFVVLAPDAPLPAAEAPASLSGSE
jgi:hypothetical protein